MYTHITCGLATQSYTHLSDREKGESWISVETDGEFQVEQE